MSVESCLGNLLRAGKISQAQHDDARAVFRGVLQDDLFRDMDQATREAYAATRTAKIISDTAQAKKLELARRTQVYNANLDRIATHPNGQLSGYMSLFDRDIRNAAPGQGFDRTNVTSLQREHYQPQIAAHMHELDTAYRSTAAGLRQDTGGIRQMIRETFGVKTGDHVAIEAAKGWKAATEWAAGQARNLGKVFDTDDEWRLPQFWDSKRANKFGESEFLSDLNGHVETGGLKVFDPDTGLVVGGADRARVLKDAADHIRMDLSRTAGPSTVFKQEARTLRFTAGEAGADAYLALMDKYGPGAGHYYGMLQGHAESMSRELALLHVFGPGFRGSSDQLLKDAIEGDARAKLKPTARTLPQRVGDRLLSGAGLEGRVAAERLNDYMTGRLSGVGSELMAGVFGGARSFLTSVNMGSAIVSALPADSVNWIMAARHLGLDSGRLVQSVTDNFLRNGADKEAFAARLGIVSHAASRVALGTKQFSDQMFGSGVVQRMADFVIRAQGLHTWDTAINRAFTMEFLASIAERGGTAFGDLDQPFASFLRGYGFTAADWSGLAAGQHIEAGPARFLMPDSLEPWLRAKLMSAIGDEKQFAYLAGGSNRVRAVAAGAKAGTAAGEMSRSFFLFKTFPVSMLATWGVRAAQEASGGKLSTALQLGLFMTMAGALAVQAKQVIAGKDLQAMKTGWFWGDAALQGGALGIYGDFLKDATSRSGTSLTESALGPLASIPAAAQRLTSGARRQAETGEKTNFGSALADDVGRFAPGSSLWYSRLLFNRMVVDNLHRLLDPDSQRSFQRAKDRAQKTYGQEFWWAPGDAVPARGPSLGAVAK